MKRTTLAVAALVSLAPGGAGAVGAQPIMDWSGFYGGLHGGFLTGNESINDAGTPEWGTLSGAIGGLLAGYGLQNGKTTYGFEGDFGFTNATGRGGQSANFAYSLTWDAHLRALLGTSMGNVQPFIAGGLALANLDTTEIGGMMYGGVYTGWTLGAGVNVALNPKVTGRAEVLYDSFGSKTYGGGYTVSLNTLTARVALIARLP